MNESKPTRGMTDNTQSDVVEAMALALAVAHDNALGEAGEPSCHAANAYRAGAGPAVGYWEALAKAALASLSTKDSDAVLEERERCARIADAVTSGDPPYGPQDDGSPAYAFGMEWASKSIAAAIRKGDNA